MTSRPSDDEDRIGSSNQPHDAQTGHFAPGNVPGTVSGHGKKGGPYAKPHSPGVAQKGGLGGGAGAGGDQGSGESDGGAAQPPKKSETVTAAPPPSGAVQAWLSSSQSEINKAAASGNYGKWEAVITALDAAIAATKPLAADQTVYRELAGAEKLTVGAVLTSKGFMPTSPDPLSATASKITVPAGSHALSLPGEVLLARGTHLRVDDVRQFTVVTPSPEKARQLVWFRVLWLRATSIRERAEIETEVRRIQGGGLRP
jgi:hypothetical protein